MTNFTLPQPFPHKALIAWYKQFGRDLPWRHTRNPYLIWLSEVILQQTRVAQGMPYYERFSQTFPTVMDLATAPEDVVMKLWEGLGYYSRARNMHKAAQAIAFEHKGLFPKKADELKKLPGIGPYTAGAISSFAFDQKAAVVDGNVQRVLGRFYCIDEIPNSTQGQKIFWNMAHNIMKSVDEPAAFNSALMDLGSDICTATQPKCSDCPLQHSCMAYSLNKTQDYPLKKTKAIVKERFIHFAYVEKEDKVAIEKRLEGDIWAGLFQFPILADHDSPIPLSSDYAMCTPLYNCRHKLTHRLLHLEVLQVDISMINLSESVAWIKKEDLKTLGFPRPLKKFIDLYL